MKAIINAVISKGINIREMWLVPFAIVYCAILYEYELVPED